MKPVIQEWEVDTFLDYLDEYVQAAIQNHRSEHVEDGLNLARKRKTLRDWIVNFVECPDDSD